MVIEQTTHRVRLLSHCIGIVRRQPERGQMHLYAEFDTELVGRIKGSGKLLRFVQHRGYRAPISGSPGPPRDVR